MQHKRRQSGHSTQDARCAEGQSLTERFQQYLLSGSEQKSKDKWRLCFREWRKASNLGALANIPAHTEVSLEKFCCVLVLMSESHRPTIGKWLRYLFVAISMGHSQKSIETSLPHKHSNIKYTGFSFLFYALSFLYWWPLSWNGFLNNIATYKNDLNPNFISSQRSVGINTFSVAWLKD